MTDPKSMARRLRADLAARDIPLTHSEALELVAHQYGARDWNTLAARTPADPTAVPPLGAAVPILRIFDRAKAVEFYVDYLGFTLDWEHGGHADHSPLYAQETRADARLHLSEHHGDASPGGAALIPVPDIADLHAQLHGRDYDYARPGIRDEEWGRVMAVIDPFHNRIVFHQPVDEWWHPAYAPAGLERVEIEGEVGGQVSMRLADGTTYPWGTVTVWEPPREYAQTFTLAQDPEHPSTLSVRIELTEANGRRHPGSRLHFAHGGWTPGNVAGRARFTEWSILLDRFAAVADGLPVPDVPPSVTGEGSG